MLNSNRFKATTAMTLAAALTVSFMAVSTASSAFAQSSRQYAPGANRHLAHPRDGAASTRSGREAFGMAYEHGFSDPNSPAATGGGSLGYNRNLMEY